METVISELRGLSHLQEHEKIGRMSAALYEWVKSAPTTSFLLVSILHCIEQVRLESILPHFHFHHFELWLNHCDGLSEEERRELRGKIAGRYLPREEYERLFPIRMGMVYSGSHYVTAHASPDLDTTISSFWGWLDSFAARVSRGLHVWNVPGGRPVGSVEMGFLFDPLFGESLFSSLPRSQTALSVLAIDLATTAGVGIKTQEDSISSVEYDGKYRSFIVVDPKGGYVGEWRKEDRNRVDEVNHLCFSMLEWHTRQVHLQLRDQFASKEATAQTVLACLEGLWEIKLDRVAQELSYTEEQRALLREYLIQILGMPGGWDGSFMQFAVSMAGNNLSSYESVRSAAESAQFFDGCFDDLGSVVLSKDLCLRHLGALVAHLGCGVESVRSYVNTFGVALQIKSKVLGLPPCHIHYLADVEEIIGTLRSHSFITVTTSPIDFHPLVSFPMGVIYAEDHLSKSLGTVTLRDFSNRDETKIPLTLDVISVMDHHKSHLASTAPMVISITDSQSCSTLVAEASFALNDRYSTGGMTQEEIDCQIDRITSKQPLTPTATRVLQRLLQRRLNSSHSQFFVAPQREIVEYLHYLYAIFDDTDLLTKVSWRDLETVASLVNRLKSLDGQEEVEVVDFDGLTRDSSFISQAATRLLQNEEVYSLYRNIYLAKEEVLEHSLRSGDIFADTKIQNGCCRVGQTKLFGRNHTTFAQCVTSLRSRWTQGALSTYPYRKEVDFHLHMISTLPSTHALHTGTKELFSHRDEIWLWVAPSETGHEHLGHFLSCFTTGPTQIEIELLDRTFQSTFETFSRATLTYPTSTEKEPPSPTAILRFEAGSINSRKAHITPHLPRLRG